jgi:hypothetical protein
VNVLLHGDCAAHGRFSRHSRGNGIIAFDEAGDKIQQTMQKAIITHKPFVSK